MLPACWHTGTPKTGYIRPTENLVTSHTACGLELIPYLLLFPNVNELHIQNEVIPPIIGKSPLYLFPVVILISNLSLSCPIHNIKRLSLNPKFLPNDLKEHGPVLIPSQTISHLVGILPIQAHLIAKIYGNTLHSQLIISQQGIQKFMQLI